MGDTSVTIELGLLQGQTQMAARHLRPQTSWMLRGIETLGEWAISYNMCTGVQHMQRQIRGGRLYPLPPKKRERKKTEEEIECQNEKIFAQIWYIPFRTPPCRPCFPGQATCTQGTHHDLHYPQARARLPQSLALINLRGCCEGAWCYCKTMYKQVSHPG